MSALNGALRAVEDRAGGEDARRRRSRRRAAISARGENLGGVVRRIVQRGHAERQRGVVDPALLRNDLVRAHRAVPVHVDDARA